MSTFGVPPSTLEKPRVYPRIVLIHVKGPPIRSVPRAPESVNAAMFVLHLLQTFLEVELLGN